MEILKLLIEDFYKSENLEEKLIIGRKYIEILSSNVKMIEYNASLATPDYEVWRNIKDYEGIYQVSNFGRIKSVERFFIKTTKGRTMAVYMPEKIRTTRHTTFGYNQIGLWKNEVVTHRLIHRLVAIHFVPNPTNYPQVLHIDDNPKNPKWDNLKWGTQSQNIQECADKGRGFVGSKNGNSKLKDSDVLKIRQLLKEGVSSRKVAKMFGVTKSPILWIRNNKSWQHLK